MQDIFLIHYYYGDRFTAFKTGLGTILRSLGHSLNSKIMIIDDSFKWLENIEQFGSMNFVLLKTDSHEKALEVLKKEFSSLEGAVFLLTNFDVLIEKKIITISDFIKLLKSKQHSNEILLTAEKKYPEIEEIADYVSLIELTEN